MEEKYKGISETTQSNLTFIQTFIQGKYGFGILFILLILTAVFTGIKAYQGGKKEGKMYADSRINSDSIEIRTLNGRVAYYKLLLDSCSSRSISRDLEAEVIKKIDEAERLKRLLERKISSDEKFNNNVNSMIK